jgi:hypothetical protein
MPARGRVGQNFVEERGVVAMARPNQIEPQLVRQSLADFGAY